MERATEAVESMYLSTIPNRKHQMTFIRSPLDVSDIQGAKSRYLEHPRPERESALRMHDIERSQPRQLIPQVVNKPSFVLEVNDIEGTRHLMQVHAPESTSSAPPARQTLSIPTTSPPK